jgi:hypothetical protein
MKFGEYLVHFGLVSRNDVLRTLEEQNRRRTFIPRMLVDRGILSAEDALKYWDDAIEQPEDYLVNMVISGHITHQQGAEVRNAWRRSAPPIDILLVQLEILTEEGRCQALAQFMDTSRSGATTVLSRQPIPNSLSVRI